jgi:hypothetical protein
MNSAHSLSQEHWPETIHNEWMGDNYRLGLVSVVVPTYNRAHYLPEVLDSVLGQEYRPIELIVVDDGSTDGTSECVESWCQSDASKELEVRYIRQENQGAPVARNRGLIESNGEYIQFLDSDDILHPRKLDIQVAALCEYSQGDLVWAPFCRFEDGAPPDWEKYNRDAALSRSSTKEVRRPEEVAHPETSLYHRRVCRMLGPWHEALARWQDWEYAFRIAACELTSIQLDEPYYALRSHTTGKIGDLKDTREGIQANLEALRAITSLRDWGGRPEVIGTIRRLYVQTLLGALTEGTDEQVSVCLQGLQTNVRTTWDWVTGYSFDALRRVAGRNVSRYALQRYIK